MSRRGPIEDFVAYRDKLMQFVYSSGLLVKPLFAAAKKDPKRIVYAEGEDERVMRAAQVVVDEGIAKPILVGRPAILEQNVQRFGLRIQPGIDFEIINPEQDARYRAYWTEYYRLTQRKGVSQQYAKMEMRGRQTLIAAMMIHMGEADGMLCGMFGTHELHLQLCRPGDRAAQGRQGHRRDECGDPAHANGLHRRHVRQCRSHTPSRSRKSRCCAVDEMRRFGITPKVALLSHSSFGSSAHPQARKMQAALALLNLMDPELEVEGEMHGDAALDEEVRLRVFPNSRLKGEANLLIMPTRGRGEHLVQPSEGCRRRRRDAGADPARRRAARAYPDAVGDGAPHREHDRAHRRRRHHAKAGAADLAIGQRKTSHGLTRR